MLHFSKSPYRAAADIMGTILKKHAERGQPAEYWDRVEQERRLVIAFDKWADKGVWSAPAQKVRLESPDPKDTGTDAIKAGQPRTIETCSQRLPRAQHKRYQG